MKTKYKRWTVVVALFTLPFMLGSNETSSSRANIWIDGYLHDIKRVIEEIAKATDLRIVRFSYENGKVRASEFTTKDIGEIDAAKSRILESVEEAVRSSIIDDDHVFRRRIHTISSSRPRLKIVFEMNSRVATFYIGENSVGYVVHALTNDRPVLLQGKRECGVDLGRELLDIFGQAAEGGSK